MMYRVLYVITNHDHPPLLLLLLTSSSSLAPLLNCCSSFKGTAAFWAPVDQTKVLDADSSRDRRDNVVVSDAVERGILQNALQEATPPRGDDFYSAATHINNP